MSYTFIPVPTLATGDTWTAAMQNTYIRDNFAGSAPGAFLAKGDLYAGIGTDTGEMLPVGADGHKLRRLNTEATGFLWSADAPGCLLFAIGPQSISDNTATALTFDTEQRDIGGYVSLPGTITIPTSHFGLYLIQCDFYFDGHATPNKYREVYISVAGHTQFFTNSTVNPVGNLDTWLEVTAIAYLWPGDQITAICRQISGGALNARQKRLSVVKLT